MAIKYLNVTPEDAVTSLNELIVEGYEIKHELDLGYTEARKPDGNGNSSASKTVVDACIAKANEWCGRTGDKLAEVYTTKRQYHEFANAVDLSVNYVSTSDNGDYMNATKNMKAKIDKLNDFDDFIKREFNVDIKLIAGDNFEVHGPGDINVQK